MLVLRPGSGLCNRLRAIGSAIKLGREIGAPLRVEWYRCPINRWAARCGMRARFDQLFCPIEDVSVMEKVVIRNDFPWNAKVWSQANPMFYADDEHDGRNLPVAEMFR